MRIRPSQCRTYLMRAVSSPKSKNLKTKINFYKKEAFTLLELIIVIIVMGVLLSLAVPRLFKIIDASTAAEAWGNISAIRKYVEACVTRTGLAKDCLNMDTLGMENPNNANGNFTYEILVTGERDPDTRWHNYYGIVATLKGTQVEAVGENPNNSCGGGVKEGGRVALWVPESRFGFGDGGVYTSPGEPLRCGEGIFSNVTLKNSDEENCAHLWAVSTSQ